MPSLCSARYILPIETFRIVYSIQAMVQKRRLAGQGGNVGSETSEQVMALLNELSALKELNKKYEGDQSGPEKESHLQRQQRQTEITE
jgi:hypothetical protein